MDARQLSLIFEQKSGRRITWDVLVLDPNDSLEFDWPVTAYDPQVSTEFPFCVSTGRVLWGVPDSRRDFLEALQRYQELQDEHSASRAAWLAVDVLRLGGLAGIW